MSWNRQTLRILLAVAVLIAAGVYGFVGLMARYDRVMGR